MICELLKEKLRSLGWICLAFCRYLIYQFHFDLHQETLFLCKNHLPFLGCVRKQQYLCNVNETKRMSGDIRNEIDSIKNLKDIIGIRPKGKR